MTRPSPAFFFGLDSRDLDAVLEAIKTTNDTKTLASPRVLVLNGQEAKIQIGAKLGFLVTTTTETSTLQNVNFLDVGVVLSVTPTISETGQVMMTVRPEISSGQINPDSGLPQEETTEVDTTVLLQDGRGMVIGGLIQERDVDLQTKIPLLGDLWAVGRLFQRKITERSRSEIIIVLTPRLVPHPSAMTPEQEAKVNQAKTPLFNGPLNRTHRPWEPRLPDAVQNPRKLHVHRLPDAPLNVLESHPYPKNYYFPAHSERDLQGEGPAFYGQTPPRP